MNWFKIASTESQLLQVAKEYGEQDVDYGKLYWHPEKKAVHWTMGDAAAYPEDDVEDAFFLRCSGVKEVIIGDEYNPPTNQGWKQLYPRKRNW